MARRPKSPIDITTRPRKKAGAPPPPPPENPIPAYIAQSPLMKKNLIKRNGLARYQEQMLLLWTPELARQFYQSVLLLMKGGDIQALKLAAEAMGLVEKSGISIVNNIQQNHIAANGSGFQFDRIVRQLALQEKTTDALPAPPGTIDVN